MNQAALMAILDGFHYWLLKQDETDRSQLVQRVEQC
jgi:hypothetical protein